MSDDTVYVVCQRISDLPKSGIDGTEKDICSKCRSEVWISPRTKQIKIEKNGVTVCMVCTLPEMIEKKVHFHLTDEQMQEVDEQVRRDVQNN